MEHYRKLYNIYNLTVNKTAGGGGEGRKKTLGIKYGSLSLRESRYNYNFRFDIMKTLLLDTYIRELCGINSEVIWRYTA